MYLNTNNYSPNSSSLTSSSSVSSSPTSSNGDSMKKKHNKKCIQIFRNTSQRPWRSGTVCDGTKGTTKTSAFLFSYFGNKTNRGTQLAMSRDLAARIFMQFSLIYND